MQGFVHADVQHPLEGQGIVWHKRSLAERQERPGTGIEIVPPIEPVGLQEEDQSGVRRSRILNRVAAGNTPSINPRTPYIIPRQKSVKSLLSCFWTRGCETLT